MATATTVLTLKADSRTWLRRVRHTAIELEMALDLVVTDPEVVVAGIEGRAIVRAGMNEYLRWIGEVE